MENCTFLRLSLSFDMQICNTDIWSLTGLLKIVFMCRRCEVHTVEIKKEEVEDDQLLVLPGDGGVKNEEEPVADRLENQTDPLLTRWVGYL